MLSRRRFLTQSLISGGISGLVSRLRAAEPGFLRKPYLQNVTADGATVCFATPGDEPWEVEVNDGERVRSFPATAHLLRSADTGLANDFYIHRARLAGLSERVDYTGNLLRHGRGRPETPDLEFRTMRPGAFRFLAFGDSGEGSPEQWALARLMNRERADFVVHTGDVVYPTGTMESYETKYFGVYADLMRRAAFYPCPGNHDYYHEHAKEYVAVHDLPTEGVPPADHGRYYSFDWGNAHFVSIDSNDPLVAAADWGGPMLAWLEADLQRTKKFWRIAYFHHPPYGSGPNRDDAYSRLAKLHVVPLLERYGVQLVLNGHEHSYQRSVPIRGDQRDDTGQGTVYVVSGGGGAPLYPVYPDPLLAAGEQVYHYVRVEVDGARLVTQAIRIDGEEIDRAVLTPPPLIAEGGVCDSISFSPRLVAGRPISVFGRNLASDSAVAPESGTEEVLGTRLNWNGHPLPLTYVSPVQVNALLPVGLAGDAVLEVKSPNGMASIRTAALSA